MVQRGEIYFAELNPVQGSEQGGTRPVLIIQNDVGNTYSPTVVALAVTARIGRKECAQRILRRAQSGLYLQRASEPGAGTARVSGGRG